MVDGRIGRRMIFRFVALFFLLVPLVYAQQTAPVGYSLYWADEFNDVGPISPTTPDRNPPHDSLCADVGNGKQCWWLDQDDFVRNQQDACTIENLNNAVIQNGVLTLRVTDESSNPIACSDGNNYNYATGGIVSRVPKYAPMTPPPDPNDRGKILFSLPHSIVQFRIRVQDGAGSWPAVWANGSLVSDSQGLGGLGWPQAGEMDMFEAYAVNYTDISAANTRWYCTRGQVHDCGPDPVKDRTRDTIPWETFTAAHRLERDGRVGYEEGGGEWPHLQNRTGAEVKRRWAVERPGDPDFTNEWIEYEFHFLPDRLQTYVNGELQTDMTCENGVYPGCTGGLINVNGFFQDPALNNGHDLGYDPNNRYTWPWDLANMRNSENENQMYLLISHQWDDGFYGMDPTALVGGRMTFEVDYIRVYTQDSGIVTRPKDMLNQGFAHPYQMPVLFEQYGEVVRAGWTGPGAVTVPDPTGVSCSGASGPGNGGYVVRDDAGLLELEGTPSYSLFWICPGDYRNAAGGELNITGSGTAWTDAGMIKAICLQPDLRKNPWQNAVQPDVPNNPFGTNHDAALECLMPEFEIDGGNYWFWQGLTLLNPDAWSTNNPLRSTNATGHTFDRVWVDCSKFRGNVSSVGGGCARFNNPSNDVIFQNGAMGPQSPYFNFEAIGWSISHQAKNMWFVNNRGWNMGHVILNGENHATGVGEGARIINNDLFNSASLSATGGIQQSWWDAGVRCASTSTYAGCGNWQATTVTERIFDPLAAPFNTFFQFDGNHETSCHQNIVALKHGSDNPANPLIFQYNRVWGSRQANVACGADNTSAPWQISTSFNSENSHILDNISFDGGGFVWAPNTNFAGANHENIILRQNLVEFADVDFQKTTTNSLFVPWALDTYVDCTGDCVGTGHAIDITIEFNTMAPVLPGTTLNINSPWNRNANRAYNTFNCNLTSEAFESGTNPVGTQNVIVDGTLYSSLTQTVDLGNPSIDDWGNYTFYYDVQRDPPLTHTIRNVIPPADATFADHCTQTAPAYDLRGNTRQLAATTPGAFSAAVAPPPVNLTYDYEYRINNGIATTVIDATSPATIAGLGIVATDVVEARVRQCEGTCGAWSSWVTADIGVIRPLPDLNNYLSYYESAVLFAGDTVEPNYFTKQVPYPQLQANYTVPEVYTVPSLTGIDCTGSADVQNGLRVLKSAADLSELSADPPAYRQFVVCPGDWRSSTQLGFGSGGSGPADDVIRKVYCASSDPRKNPVQRNPNWRDGLAGDPFVPNYSSDECVLPHVIFNGDSNWFLSGLTFGTTAVTGSAIFETRDGASNIVLDRARVACYNGAASGTDYGCVRLGNTGNATNILIQNSVIGPCTPWNDGQSDGIWTGIDATNVHIVDTAIVDCSRGAATGYPDVAGGVTNNVFENVDIVHTDYMRATCDQAVWDSFGLGDRNAGRSTTRTIHSAGVHAAAFSPAFECSCGRDLLFIQQETNIINSRIMGARSSAARCMVSKDTTGTSIELDENPGGSFFADNYFQSRRGYYTSTPSLPGASYNVEFVRNMWEMTPEDDSAYKSPVDRRYITHGATCTGCVDNGATLRLNKFATPPPVQVGAGSIGDTVNDPVVFDCNEAFGGNTAGANVTGQDNVAIGGANLTGWGVTGTQVQSINEAGRVSRQFWRNLQTIPEQYTTPPMFPTMASRPTVCGL